MLFSKQDYEYLLNSLSKKFALYEFIDNNYLMNMLDSLMNDGCFEDLKIVADELSKDMNPLFHISFRIQNYLYYKICKLCEDDIEVLLNLVEDKRRVINLIFRKMKVEDDTKLDDYVMNIASLYNGVESFDSFVTRYVMSAIKGVQFEVEKAPVLCVAKEPEIVDDKKKKNKGKKKKNKDKQKAIVSIIETKPKEVETKTKKVIEEVLPISVNTSIQEEIQVEIEEVTQEVVDSQEIVSEVVSEEALDNTGEESVPEIVEEKTWYQKCLDKCEDIVGTGIRDNFITMVLMSDLVDKVTMIEDEGYKIYFLMRFGLMNESFYTREEIALVMDVSLEDVIKYERYTLSMLRDYINRAVNNYEEYILRK